MREIKFRGKRIDNGEWVHGGIITSASRAWIKNNENLFINPLRINQSTADFRLDEVIPSTVGQYTGLKDKNRTEIFEGDICVCKKQGILADAFEIFWRTEEGCWGWKESDESLDPFYQSIANYTEVISNKWDNPELLGGAE